MNPEISLQHINGVVRKARRQQLRQALLLGFFAVMTVMNLVFAVRVLLAAATDFSSVLPALALSMLAATVLVHLWRTARRERQRYAALSTPTTQALAAAATATRKHLQAVKHFRSLVIVVMLPLFALTLVLLFKQGKMEAVHVAGFAALLAPIVAVIMIVTQHRIRHQLEPRLNSLSSLQAQFESND